MTKIDYTTWTEDELEYEYDVLVHDLRAIAKDGGNTSIIRKAIEVVEAELGRRFAAQA